MSVTMRFRSRRKIPASPSPRSTPSYPRNGTHSPRCPVRKQRPRCAALRLRGVIGGESTTVRGAVVRPRRSAGQWARGRVALGGLGHVIGAAGWEGPRQLCGPRDVRRLLAAAWAQADVLAEVGCARCAVPAAKGALVRRVTQICAQSEKKPYEDMARKSGKPRGNGSLRVLLKEYRFCRSNAAHMTVYIEPRL